MRHMQTLAAQSYPSQGPVQLCCPHTECLLCLAQVSESEIRIAQRAEREQEKIKKTMKARMDFLDLID